MKYWHIIILLIIISISGSTFPQASQWFKFTTSNSDLPTNSISNMYKDKNGIFWLGTHVGLVKIEPWENWQVYNSSNSGLHNNYATEIYVDRLNNVWVATSQEGMYYFVKYDGFTWSTVDSGQTCFSIDNEIFRFAVYSNGMKWINSNWLRLFLYPNVCQVFTNEDLSIYTGYKATLFIDDNDVFWFSNEVIPQPLHPPGMAKTDGSSWVIKEYTYHFSIDTINNVVWGSTNHAIEKINIENLSLIQKYYFPDVGNYTIAIFADKMGNVWTYTYGNINQLYKFEPDSLNWKIFNLNSVFSYVKALDEDDYGNIVLATPNDGLVLFNEQGVVINSVDDSKLFPDQFVLKQNYPNPFNPSTTIDYTIPHRGNVKTLIYNSLGQNIRILENGYKSAGNYQLEFDADDLPSGVYFYQVIWADKKLIKKMVLLK